ncbi:hypothetical protein Lepto7375DRAFT_6855 [Leptolyngbya sp. PCC 7375]|nr:hypothetical protein Lepto7375DRAFT_6855 [Leptolyngbya sp. PCC 7375]
MYFVSPFFLAWSRKSFKYWRFSRRQQPSNFSASNERSLTVSTDKHHVDAVSEVQKVKRLYFLERGPFM